jgi:hypothetical protein
MVVVVAMFFGHLDGEEHTAGYPRIDGTLAMDSPKSCSRGQDQRHWVVCGIGRVRGFFFGAKAQPFDANDGDACRNFIEGAIVVTFATLGL